MVGELGSHMLHIWKLKTEQRGFPGGASGKEFTCNVEAAGDTGLIPGSGRSPGRGNGNPLHYFCLENLIDRGAQQGTVHEVVELDTTKQLNMNIGPNSIRI